MSSRDHHRKRGRSRSRSRSPEGREPGLGGGGELKAMVSESNGEISCSVEETNRIRALLGLAPLRMGKHVSQEEIAVENYKKLKEQEAKERELADVQARLEKVRKKRLLHEQLQGDKLGEVKKDEDSGLSSAAAWVQRSRKVAEAKKEEERLLAEQRRRMLMEEEEEEEEEEYERRGKKGGYGAKDLGGLKVAHGADAFKEGEQVVLTLKDSSVLASDEHGNLVGLNENEEDELENIMLAEDDKVKERQRRAKRAKMPVYSGYDDDEFEEGVAPGKKRSVLAHYDNEDGLAKRKEKKMVLTSEGGAVELGGKGDEEEEEGVKSKGEAVSLKVDKQAVMEYYTQEEAAKFNKPKKLRKKKTMRKKESDLVAELEESADAMDTTEDRGSRQAAAAKAEATRRAETAETQESYQRAVEKRVAQDKVAASLQKKKPAPPTLEFEEDLDPDLAASLQRARRLAMMKEKASVSDSLKKVAEEIKIKNSIKPEEGTGGETYTSTVEFSELLKARLEERNRQRAQQVAEGGEEEAEMEVEEEEEEEKPAQPVGGGVTPRGGVRDGKKGVWAEAGDEDEEDDDKEKKQGGGKKGKGKEEVEDELSFMYQPPPVAKGLAGTLNLLRSKGDLVTQETLVGRAKDKKSLYDVGPMEEAGAEKKVKTDFSDLKIEYRDEHGRLLTTKEEFRRQSYKFHGHGPGVMKQQKRAKKIAEEMARNSTNSGVNRDIAVANLEKAQESTGQAFLVLSGSNKGFGGAGGGDASGGKKDKRMGNA